MMNLMGGGVDLRERAGKGEGAEAGVRREGGEEAFSSRPPGGRPEGTQRRQRERGAGGGQGAVCLQTYREAVVCEVTHKTVEGAIRQLLSLFGSTENLGISLFF